LGSDSRGRLEITERDVDGVRILALGGELDLATAGELCARVDAARAGGERRLLIDLGAVEFCDSSGLRALIGASEEVAASAGVLAVIPPRASGPAQVFAVSGAEELLPLHATIGAALAALSVDRRGPTTR